VDNHFEPLAVGEVLSIEESAQILIGHRTFRVGEFADAVKTQMQTTKGWTKEKDAWFSEDGIPCEVLRFTANGWQKGKVRIHLEFCPQDFEAQPQAASATVPATASPAAVVDTSEQLNLGDSLLDDDADSLNLEDSLLDDDADSLNLEDSLLDDEAESVILVGPPVDDDSDSLNLDELSSTMNDELDSEEFASSLDDEFSITESTKTTVIQDDELAGATLIHTEQDIIILPGEGDGLELDSMSTSLDDDLDLGEISQSIDQELELVEAPLASDDELLDLGMSLDSNDDLDFGEMSAGTEADFQFDELSVGGDDDLDFGEMSAGSEDDDFQFEDISLGNEPENKENDSLLDDVWQDINQASWKNNH
jgi:pilus assembly protein FimV